MRYYVCVYNYVHMDFIHACGFVWKVRDQTQMHFSRTVFLVLLRQYLSQVGLDGAHGLGEADWSESSRWPACLYSSLLELQACITTPGFYMNAKGQIPILMLS